MKKILVGLSVIMATAAYAQAYPDYYPSYQNDSYYGSEEDAYYFPDDYYYDFPEDYYTDDLYRSYYEDYRRSIYSVNWNRFAAKYRLSPWQVREIMLLNESFPSFAAWNAWYRHNPDRWYYDRFYALERILGPRIFVVYQNNYYRGYSPVVYFQNYRRTHYVTNVYVVPRYRNVNVTRYRVDRQKYHQTVPRQQFGFEQSPRQGSGNWSQRNDVGFRSEIKTPGTTNQNGFRNGTVNSGSRTEGTRERQHIQKPSMGDRPQVAPGFRGGQRSAESLRPAPNTDRSGGATQSKSGFRFSAG